MLFSSLCNLPNKTYHWVCTYMSNTTSATCEAGSAKPFQCTWEHPGFWWDSCYSVLRFLIVYCILLLSLFFFLPWCFLLIFRLIYMTLYVLLVSYGSLRHANLSLSHVKNLVMDVFSCIYFTCNISTLGRIYGQKHIVFKPVFVSFGCCLTDKSPCIYNWKILNVFRNFVKLEFHSYNILERLQIQSQIQTVTTAELIQHNLCFNYAWWPLTDYMWHKDASDQNIRAQQ